jgi:hypothetical protein
MFTTKHALSEDEGTERDEGLRDTKPKSRPLMTKLFLGALLLLCACSTPYYERAVDPPGFSHGGGAAAKVFLVVENDEEWYYACGPVLTGYVRHRGTGRLSLSAQLDMEHALPVPGSRSYWAGHSITSGSLIGGLKFATWRGAAIKVNCGVIGEAVKRHRDLSLGAAPLLDVALLQDFWDRNPLTGRLSVGTGGVQVGIGWEFPLSKSLRGRLSAGTELFQLGMPFFVPPPLGAHIGLAIEPRRSD